MRTRTAGRARVGLLGGTFNPVHAGHLHIAREVRRRFKLNRILLIPSYLPPHKNPAEVAPAADRMRMVELACRDSLFLIPSPVEIKIAARSYSVFTLARVKKRFPGARIFFILGIDAFQEIETWKDYEKVLRQCHFIVVNRPGFRLDRARRILGGRLRPETLVLRKEKVREPLFDKYRVFLTPLDGVDVSSTEVRRRVRDGKSIRGMVPRAVEAYIFQRRLYQGEDG